MDSQSETEMSGQCWVRWRQLHCYCSDSPHTWTPQLKSSCLSPYWAKAGAYLDVVAVAVDVVVVTTDWDCSCCRCSFDPDCEKESDCNLAFLGCCRLVAFAVAGINLHYSSKNFCSGSPRFELQLYVVLNLVQPTDTPTQMDQLPPSQPRPGYTLSLS